MRRLLLAFAGLTVVACGPGHDRARTLTVTGSSTVAPLANEIGKRFEDEHPGVRIDVQTGGSSRGVAEAHSGLNDVGMCSRALSADEADLQAFTIAFDGICVVLHRDNPLAGLTDEQVVAIYTGAVTNWRDVGGRDAPITVVNKAEGRSTLELFCAYFRLEPMDIQAHVVIGDNEQGIKTVVGNPNSIGYVSIGAAAQAVTSGAALRLLPVSGVAASIQAVQDGTFPLTRSLNLVVKAPASELARQFIDYALSGHVHDLVRGQHFVPSGN